MCVAKIQTMESQPEPDMNTLIVLKGAEHCQTQPEYTCIKLGSVKNAVDPNRSEQRVNTDSGSNDLLSIN